MDTAGLPAPSPLVLGSRANRSRLPRLQSEKAAPDAVMLGFRTLWPGPSPPPLVEPPSAPGCLGLLPTGPEDQGWRGAARHPRPPLAGRALSLGACAPLPHVAGSAPGPRSRRASRARPSAPTSSGCLSQGLPRTLGSQHGLREALKSRESTAHSSFTKSQKITSVGKDVEKSDPCARLAGT